MYYINPNINGLYRTSYSESRQEFLRLDMNENPEGLSSSVFNEVMKRMTPEIVAMYPEMDSLRHKLAAHLEVMFDQVYLTNGSDDAIRLLFEVFGEKGKKFVSVSPSFEMYIVYMQMYGMNHSPVIYNEKFEADIEEILNAIDQDAGIVALLNPNSPIGKPWAEKEVIRMIEKARENKAVVVIDEAYHYFSPHTFLDLVRRYDNVIVFRTFSKLFSIAGTRIGYVVSNIDFVTAIKKASSTYPVNCFGIAFAEYLIDHPKVVTELIEQEKQGRQYLVNELEKADYEYYYNQGNYVLIKPLKEPQNVFDCLKVKGILIKTYKAPVLKNWIRVTTGGPNAMRTFWESFFSIDQA